MNKSILYDWKCIAAISLGTMGIIAVCKLKGFEIKELFNNAIINAKEVAIACKQS